VVTYETEVSVMLAKNIFLGYTIKKNVWNVNFSWRLSTSIQNNTHKQEKTDVNIVEKSSQIEGNNRTLEQQQLIQQGHVLKIGGIAKSPSKTLNCHMVMQECSRAVMQGVLGAPQ